VGMLLYLWPVEFNEDQSTVFAGKVGIGASPDSALHVDFGASGYQILEYDTDQYAGFEFQQGGSDSAWFMYDDRSGHDRFYFMPASGSTGDSIMSLNQTGNVGINTGAASPTNLLTIDGGVGVDSGGGVLGIRQKGDTSSDGITLTSSQANSSRFWKDSSGHLHIHATVASANSFVLATDGKVGIGTIPSVTLDVNDGTDNLQGKFTRNTSSTNALTEALSARAYSTGNKTDDFGAGIGFIASDSGNTTTLGQIGAVGDGGDTYGAVIIKSANNGSLIERARFTSVGNLDLKSNVLDHVDEVRSDKDSSITDPMYTWLGDLSTGLGFGGGNAALIIANGGQRQRWTSSTTYVYTDMSMQGNDINNVGDMEIDASKTITGSGDLTIDAVGNLNLDGGNDTVLMNSGQTICLVDDVGLRLSQDTAHATTAGTNIISLFNGTAPVGTIQNGASFFCASGQMKVIQANGTATDVSPHNPETDEWWFNSKDVHGRVFRVHMERLMRKLDEMLGGGFIEEFIEEG